MKYSDAIPAVLFLCIVMLFVGWYRSNNERGITFAEDIEYTDGVLAFEGGEIDIAFAETTQERQAGLSNQRMLGEREGLLFIFNEAAKHGIWMRDMHFVIDIIWLDANLRVVDIEESASPESFRSVFDAEVFTPDAPASYVLEVQAGFVQDHNVMVGDTFLLTVKK